MGRSARNLAVALARVPASVVSGASTRRHLERPVRRDGAAVHLEDLDLHYPKVDAAQKKELELARELLGPAEGDGPDKQPPKSGRWSVERSPQSPRKSFAIRK